MSFRAKKGIFVFLPRSSQRGFTLIEVLIVIIILGVIAGLAIVLYRAQVEKSRQTEAIAVLSAIREAEVRLFSEDGTYTASFAELDYTPPSTFAAPETTDAAGQTLHFDYDVATPSATTFTATAKRNSVNGGDGSSTVTINQAGTVTKTGAYA